MMELPPPLPTVDDAIAALRGRGQRLTIKAVQQELVALRGFDASTREVAAALRLVRANEGSRHEDDAGTHH